MTDASPVGIAVGEVLMANFLLPMIQRGEKPNLLLTRTFSKIYGLAGLRIGYGIGHPEFVAALEKIRQPFNTNSLAQAAALAALDDNEHLSRTRENNQRGLAFLEGEFRRMGLEFIPLQEERYDLVVPTPYLTEHPGLANLLDTILSRQFRTEIEALGGYDTRETGKVREF